MNNSNIHFVKIKNPLKDYYTSFKDKEESIHTFDRRIKSKEDLKNLFDWLSKAKELGYIIFRGVSESYYKHYSHSQRQFSTFHGVYNAHDLFYELIFDTVQYAKKWNNGSIKNYLLKRGITENFFAYLSLMQHFGIPTPLIDFTKNPYVALYFAASKKCIPVDENNINEFCSLYFINKDYPYLRGFRNHFENTVKGNLLNNYSRERSLYYGLQFTPQLIINETDELFQVTNNINIVNQEGLFILNGSPYQPLEDQHNSQVKARKEMLEKKRKSSDNSVSPKMFGCWEIHKSLNESIRIKLEKEFGINESFLFPNMNKLKSDFQKGFIYPKIIDLNKNGSYWSNRPKDK